MTRHAKTERLIATSVEILQAHRPMTVRQVYYQLVSRQVIENSRGAYQSVSKALIGARQDGIVPWEWIEDRLRRPRHVSMWTDIADFGESAIASYRRDVWATQPRYFEAWLEKDALSGIFEDVLEPYGVTLNVGRGYDGWSSINSAAERFYVHGNATIIYFGDFDPSGEDMVRSLKERLDWFGLDVEIIKAALTRDDINNYGLPPDFTKATDTRRAKFVEKHGDISVELDALPVDILRQRIIEHVEARMDLDSLAGCRATEDGEREQLRGALAGPRP
jgi:hypothetical protein